MSPTVILIRHGEAEHNFTRDYSIPDPLLTGTGEEQCRKLEHHLQANVPLANQIEAIITSPFRRTIQTTEIGLKWLIQKGVKVEADALWQGEIGFFFFTYVPRNIIPKQVLTFLMSGLPILRGCPCLVLVNGSHTTENSDKPCDTGSVIASLKKQYQNIDFSTVDPVFPSKARDTIYAFTRTAVLARGQTVLRKLQSRPEKVIAVVSHSAFLRTAVSRRKYANADFRVFTFADDSKDGDLRLVESELTSPSGGMGESRPDDVTVEPWEFPTAS